MTDERYDAISAAFQEAIGMGAEERGAFLSRLRQRQPSICQEVVSLLDADKEMEADPGAWSEGRLGHGRMLFEEIASGEGEPEEDPATIGPYEVLEKLGEGGMGTVFLCRQEIPRREVAVKVIKVGMDTPQVVRRFELEREVLARLDHPGIASVLDAGSTESGRPFFVMEACVGQQLVDFCDLGQLDLEQRLALFLQVVHAVEHAHQRGVLHRDLKPSNILVSRIDGQPRVKIIDFGLARAMGSEGEASLMTHTGQLLGTPAYMSPEQATLDSSEIDVRSDVYSMGVVLYELLTGSLPYEEDETTPVHAALARLTQGERAPRRPTSSLPKDEESRSEVASRRGMTPAVLRRALRGELEWIVLRALEPDRERRYPSALFFARDIEAYLEGRPVEAAPPSTFYVLRKAVARHKALASALVIAFLSLSLGLVVSLVQRDLAIASEAETRQMLDEVHDYNDIMRHMLNSADPRMVGRSAQVTDMLERGLEYMYRLYSDNPRIMAEVQATIGRSYAGLGLWKSAEPLLTDAVQQRRVLNDGNFARMGGDLHDLGIYQLQAGQYREAEANFREAIEWFEAIPVPMNIERKSRWEVSLATVLLVLDEPDEAEQLVERAIPVMLAAENTPLVTTARGYAVHGHLCAARGEADEARAWFDKAREAVGTIRTPEQIQYAEIEVRRGVALTLLGLGAEACEVLEPAVATARIAFGPEPAKCDALDALAGAYLLQSRHDEARGLLEESLEALTRHQSPGSVRIAMTELLVGQLELGQERELEGRERLERALEVLEPILGAGHPRCRDARRAIPR